jgi:adenosyl cobinamide kinase/adenosyl cobinamide phosphate guanylyltransferase
VRLAADHPGPAVFVATCPRLPGDADLERRILRHRADRPDWPTIEEQHDLEGALRGAGDDAFVIVDCLSLWVWNLCRRGDGADDIVRAAGSFAAVAAARRAPTIAVSNEVGMGVHPETEEGRLYRDLLGAVNRAIAAIAAPTLLMVAGRALRLDDPKELLA